MIYFNTKTFLRQAVRLHFVVIVIIKALTTYIFLWKKDMNISNYILIIPNSDADETKNWINEKDKVLSSDDYGKDLASVNALLRKHEALERDLAAVEDKVTFFLQNLIFNVLGIENFCLIVGGSVIYK